MTLQQARQVLKDYNEWRRHHGEPTPHPHSALTIGVAIDVAIEAMWKLGKLQEIIFFGEGGARE